MKTTFKVVENKNWYLGRYTNKAELRFEVRQYDDGDEAGLCSTSSSFGEAQSRAADRQADEDAGLTIQGMAADDRRAIDAGMAGDLIAYEDALPQLIADLGLEAARARHPWRAMAR